MAEIERIEIIGDAPARRAPDAAPGGRSGGPGDRARAPGGRPRLPMVAAALLVVGCLIAVGVLAVLLHDARADRRAVPGPTPAERAAVSVVAIDAHDLTALDTTAVPDAGVLLVGATGVLDRPFHDRAFVYGGRLTYEPDLRLTVVGAPRAVGDLQVTMTVRLSSAGQVSTAQTVVNLERRVAGPKVSAVIMTLAPTGKLPSEA
jgi:hypothetical protein